MYTLQSPEVGRAAAREHLQPVWVQLGSVGVPAEVDQMEWLVSTPDGSLRLLEQTRWAAPLHDQFRAALLDALHTRWAVSSAQQGVPAKAPVWRVVVDVLRFDALPGLEARLDASWSISATGPDATGSLATCRARWATNASGDVSALADAHRNNLGSLADAIGNGLQAAALGAAVPCSASGASLAP